MCRLSPGDSLPRIHRPNTITKGRPIGRPFLLAAAATAFALTATHIAAAAEQDQKDDDPAQIAATETAVATKVTHNTYLQDD